MPQSGSHKPPLIRGLASGQCAWTLPLVIGAILQRPRNSPASLLSSSESPSSTPRLAASSGFIKTSSRLAPVNGSRSRCIMLLNCLPRRVERRKTTLGLVPSIGDPAGVRRDGDGPVLSIGDSARVRCEASALWSSVSRGLLLNIPCAASSVAISIGENRARPSAVGKYWVLLPAVPIFSQSRGPPHWIWSPVFVRF